MSCIIRNIVTVSALLCGHFLQAEVVFDGSIGTNPAGTTVSGNFSITEADGVVSGNNLFHSFQGFNVNPGEAATFTHSNPNIVHIISRVTGGNASAINGGILLRQDTGGTLSPTPAALWLINPAGIVIGDGAFLDPQGVFYFSTANRIGFDNGDDFFSHDVSQHSTLSVATPAAFGFLDKQELPADFRLGNLRIAVEDSVGSNTAVFLSALTLVGTSTIGSAAVTIEGDVDTDADLTTGVLPASSQIQLLKLDVAGLGDGGAVQFVADELLAYGDTAAVTINNSNVALSDSGLPVSAGFRVYASNLTVTQSTINAQATLQPAEIRFSAPEAISVVDSFVGTATAVNVNAGDIVIDTGSYLQRNALLQSFAADFGGNSGAAGNILFGTSSDIPLTSFTLESGQLFSISNTTGSSGDIVVNAQGEVVVGNNNSDLVSISSLSNASSSVGNVAMAGQHISTVNTLVGVRAGTFTTEAATILLSAGDGGMVLENTSIVGSPAAGIGADILLQSQADINISATSSQLIGSSSIGGGSGAGIFFDAANQLTISGEIEVFSRLFAGSIGDAASNPIALNAKDILLSGANSAISSTTFAENTGADVLINADGALSVTEGFSVNSASAATGQAGSLFMQGDKIQFSGSESATVDLTSSALSSGDAGRVVVTGNTSATLTYAVVSSVPLDGGAAGEISIDTDDLTITNSRFITTTISDDSNDAAARINLRGNTSLVLDQSFLQSNTANDAPAGQIVLESGGALALTQTAIQSGSLGAGSSGDIKISAAGTVSISGADTVILTNSTGSSQAGDVLISGSTVSFFDRAAIQTSAEGSGDAGTIRFTGDQLMFSGGSIEGTSLNAGGGDIEFYASDIRLDGSLTNDEIVFIATDSQASDALGNGGSITLGDPKNPAASILVRRSGLTASAAAGNGGRININADAFLRDALSVFQVTSQSGAAGSLEINAPEQDISATVKALNAQFLDTAGLLRSYCDRSSDKKRSTLELWDGSSNNDTEDYQPSSASLLLPSVSVSGDLPQPTKQLAGALIFSADACGK